MSNNGPHAFPIVCAHCSLACAEVQGDTLVIVSRHGGDKHITVIPLAYFQALAPQGAYFRAIMPQPLDMAQPLVYSKNQ